LTEVNIIYTEIALEDLRRIPRRFAAWIVAKISRLEHGLRRDIKRLTNFDCDYRLRCGDYRVLFDVEDDEVLVHSYPAPQRGL
jgi:mRNA interferase RelE/StbE